MANKVVIVDDESMVRKVLEQFVTRKPNFEVVGDFDDGIGALTYIEKNPIDLLISDIRMPGMDGLDLIATVRECQPMCHIIIISGYGQFEYAQRAIKYQVSNFLLKPIDFDELGLQLDQIALRLNQYHATTQTNVEQYQACCVFVNQLLTQEVKNNKMLANRFEELTFPFSLARSTGVIVRFRLTTQSIARWPYGVTDLANAVRNQLQKVAPNLNAYLIMSQTDKLDYLVVGSMRANFWKDLIATLAETLDLHAECQELSRFATILDAQLDSHELKIGGRTATNYGRVVTQAIDFMNQHYSSGITRVGVAKSVFLSEAYFSQIFKKETGYSFSDYLTMIRMEEAIKLLRTDMRVNDIAEKVGYQGRNRFFINFKQYTSYNPTEYRQLHNGIHA